MCSAFSAIPAHVSQYSLGHGALLVLFQRWSSGLVCFLIGYHPFAKDQACSLLAILHRVLNKDILSASGDASNEILVGSSLVSTSEGSSGIAESSDDGDAETGIVSTASSSLATSDTTVGDGDATKDVHKPALKELSGEILEAISQTMASTSARYRGVAGSGLPSLDPYPDAPDAYLTSVQEPPPLPGSDGDSSSEDEDEAAGVARRRRERERRKEERERREKKIEDGKKDKERDTVDSPDNVAADANTGFAAASGDSGPVSGSTAGPADGSGAAGRARRRFGVFRSASTTGSAFGGGGEFREYKTFKEHLMDMHKPHQKESHNKEDKEQRAKKEKREKEKKESKVEEEGQGQHREKKVLGLGLGLGLPSLSTSPSPSPSTPSYPSSLSHSSDSRLPLTPPTQSPIRSPISHSSPLSASTTPGRHSHLSTGSSSHSPNSGSGSGSASGSGTGSFRFINQSIGPVQTTVEAWAWLFGRAVSAGGMVGAGRLGKKQGGRKGSGAGEREGEGAGEGLVSSWDGGEEVRDGGGGEEGGVQIGMEGGRESEAEGVGVAGKGELTGEDGVGEAGENGGGTVEASMAATASVA
ncbi:unnamed protein product [Closterium sp. Yama58-4]|nr:unnamed protein product [Closterium sp. Yama58-4]